MSEKKIVSFFRLAATLVVCVPVKIELYNWGGRNLANLDDSWARSSFFSVSSICLRLSSTNPAEMAIIANRTTSQLRLRWRVPINVTASCPLGTHAGRRQIRLVGAHE